MEDIETHLTSFVIPFPINWVSSKGFSHKKKKTNTQLVLLYTMRCASSRAICLHNHFSHRYTTIQTTIRTTYTAFYRGSVSRPFDNATTTTTTIKRQVLLLINSRTTKPTHHPVPTTRRWASTNKSACEIQNVYFVTFFCFITFVTIISLVPAGSPCDRRI